MTIRLRILFYSFISRLLDPSLSINFEKKISLYVSWLQDELTTKINKDAIIGAMKHCLRKYCIIFWMFTCIRTLAVSRGKVARSAMQAAVPAVRSFVARDTSFCMSAFIFFSLRRELYDTLYQKTLKSNVKLLKILLHGEDSCSIYTIYRVLIQLCVKNLFQRKISDSLKWSGNECSPRDRGSCFISLPRNSLYILFPVMREFSLVCIWQNMIVR